MVLGVVGSLDTKYWGDYQGFELEGGFFLKLVS
jgi:hypothetical protein